MESFSFFIVRGVVFDVHEQHINKRVSKLLNTIAFIAFDFDYSYYCLQIMCNHYFAKIQKVQNNTERFRVLFALVSRLILLIKDEEQDKTNQCERYTCESRIAVSTADSQSSGVCTDSISQIKGNLHGSGSQHFTTF